ncbi:MAG: hypothetical protein HYZ28_04990 [Myxococcales bacterium]|nr:hypothetical protein [Myxococcales bacterium]
MIKLRWVLAGFAAGCLIALAPSCGTQKPRCNPSNCNGCCDAQGSCRPGANNAECGARGSACSACAPNQVCQLGICTFANNTACAPATCTGCCGSGGCQAGNLTTACGSGGNACVECQPGQTCENGQCKGTPTDGGNTGDGGTCGPSNCTGCCRNGICDTSNSNLACGKGGVACVVCSGSEVCTSFGTCQVPGSCNSTNCATGCCSGGLCVPYNQQTASQCGSGGSVCIGCTPGNSCVNGTCVGTQGCGPGTTNPCSTGCCSGFGANALCLLGTSNTNCGTGGAQCQTCNTSAGQSCQAQQCQGGSADAGSSLTGKACSFASDCAGLGTGAQCRQSTQTGAGTYSGGYCTKTCQTNADCPTDAMCMNFGATYDEPSPLCVNKCQPPNSTSSPQCRTGYACYGLSGNPPPPDGVCWIYPPPQLDAGISNKTGQPCAGDTQCQNPPLDGFCIEATLPDGGQSGFTGGSCSAPCTDDTKCGTNGICIGFGSGTAYCFSSCTAPLGGQSTCRSTYNCSALYLADGGLYPTGMCWPSCLNPGNACPSGYTCNASGYCCDTSSPPRCF